MKNYKKLALGAATALLSVTMLATPVLAEVGGTVTKDAGAQTSQADSSQTEQEARYMTFTSEVTSFSKTEDGYTIGIGGIEDGVVFHTQGVKFVLDQASNQLVSLDDIKEGMTITGVVPANSPMTLSLPPQTSSAIGFIINSETGSMDKDIYNENLVNSKNTLQLASLEGTKLIAANGNKMALTAEDLKGAELLVLYTVSTKSIPAQTTPETVILLASAADLAQEEAVEPQKEAQQPVATTDDMVALRSSLEDDGYKITWNGMNKPITIQNETYIYTINIGSTTYTRDLVATSSETQKETLQFQTAPELQNNEITMVERSFIRGVDQINHALCIKALSKPDRAFFLGQGGKAAKQSVALIRKGLSHSQGGVFSQGANNKKNWQASGFCLPIFANIDPGLGLR